MRLSPNTLNVNQMGIGLMLLFIAFFSQSFIEETVLKHRSKTDSSIAPNAGYISQTIIYGSFLFANIIAPPLVGWLGCKWSLVVGAITYILLMVGFIFLNTPFLYLSSAAEGIGSGLLWTAVGHYLALNSCEKNIGRNSSLIWLWHTSGLFVGGVFLLVVFGSRDTEDIDVETTRILYGSFTGLATLGTLVFAFLKTPESEDIYRQKMGSYKDELMSSFRLIFTPDMALLSITSAFAGQEMSFWSEVYSTGLSFTKKFAINTNQLMAYNAMAIGIGQMSGSILFGLYGDRTMRYGRYPIMIFSTALGLIAYALTFLNLPEVSNYKETDDEGYITPSIPIALVCGGIFGLVDAAVNTQIYSFTSIRYKHATPQAFAISKFFHSLLSTVCMYYGSVFTIGWQLLLLSVGHILSTVSFTIVEKRFMAHQRRQREMGDEYLVSYTEEMHNKMIT